MNPHPIYTDLVAEFADPFTHRNSDPSTICSYCHRDRRDHFPGRHIVDVHLPDELANAGATS